MAVNANQDPDLGDTSQKHETHTQAGTVTQFVNSLVTIPPSGAYTNVPSSAAGWTLDPASVVGSLTAVSNTTYFTSIIPQRTMAVSNIYVALGSPAASGLSTTYITLHAANGNGLMTGADVSASFNGQSSTVVVVTFSNTLTVQAGTTYVVSLGFSSGATTYPTFGATGALSPGVANAPPDASAAPRTATKTGVGIFNVNWATVTRTNNIPFIVLVP